MKRHATPCAPFSPLLAAALLVVASPGCGGDGGSGTAKPGDGGTGGAGGSPGTDAGAPPPRTDSPPVMPESACASSGVSS